MKKKDKENKSSAIIVSEVFTFEQRDSKGRLIATNKNLKKMKSIKVWLRRLIRRARI